MTPPLVMDFDVRKIPYWNLPLECNLSCFSFHVLFHQIICFLGVKLEVQADDANKGMTWMTIILINWIRVDIIIRRKSNRWNVTSKPCIFCTDLSSSKYNNYEIIVFFESTVKYIFLINKSYQSVRPCTTNNPILKICLSESDPRRLWSAIQGIRK